MSVSRKGSDPAPIPMSWLAASLLAAALAHGQAAALAPARNEKIAPPSAAPASVGRTELASQIALAEGKSTLIHLPYPVARLAVGDARVADVILINPSELYLLGKSTGSTNLILWNKAKQATIVDITVGIDTTALRNQFEHLLPNEKDIRITVSGGTLILSGMVSDSLKLAQVLELATTHMQHSARPAAPAALSGTAPAAAPLADPSPQGGAAGKVINMLSVAAPQQVMLEVKIAEVSKSLVDQLGASIGASAVGGNWTYTFLSNLLTGKPGMIDGFNGKSGNFATLDAQKRDGLVKILAEPTVMAISGQEASFLAGGKIFIPVAQNHAGIGTVITLEEKEFGVAVKFTPTVLEGGRINLRVAPEVSELNREGIGISAAGVSAGAVLPSFTTRRASTTVQLFDGQSFAIGGLIKNNVTTNIKSLPLLGEIPVLGALFRSSDFQTDRTELVFIVTPHLARPLPPGQPLPTDNYVAPSRAEFFLGGKMEGRRPAAPAPGFDVK